MKGQDQQESQKIEAKTNFEKKNLFIILAVLIVATIGLIIGIVIVSIDSSDQLSSSSQEDSEETNQGESTSDDCAQLSNTEKFIMCVEGLYANGDENAANKLYNERMEKALAEKDDMAFIDIISSKATVKFSQDSCDEALEIYKDPRIEQLSADDRIYLYNEAYNMGAECNNSNEQVFFQQKIDQIIESGEATSAYDQ